MKKFLLKLLPFFFYIPKKKDIELKPNSKVHTVLPDCQMDIKDWLKQYCNY